MGTGASGISSCTFEYCQSLENVYIPKNITTIYVFAFDNCSAIKNIYYSGTEAEWNNITIENNNDALSSYSVTIHYETTF